MHIPENDDKLAGFYRDGDVKRVQLGDTGEIFSMKYFTKYEVE